MTEEIAFQNGGIYNFKGLVTLTLHQVILHTVMHHLLTSTYMPNFIEAEETFVDGPTYFWVDRRTFETHFIRSTQKSQLKNVENFSCVIIPTSACTVYFR